jgi:ABC-type multidrug transport system ATPase subunit
MTAAATDFDRVEILEVSRHFGRRKAVSKVSLSLQRGDILGLLGPNGAGKSTLLSMLATLVTPSSGQIAYGSMTATKDGSRLRARIGVLGHELHLYPELSAKQNLQFFASLYGLDPAVVVPRALDAANLTDRADDQVSSFSRGMRQRLALERSLMHQPTLILLDEPFTGLDDRAVGIVARRFRELASAGAILVVATHDLDVADGLITRMAVIQSGKLLRAAEGGSQVRQQYRALVGGAH